MTTFCIVAGTSPLLTGMLEPSGPVAQGELRASHRALVDQMMQAEPCASARGVFWVMDNGASHRNWAAAARLGDAYPNARMVRLPVHADAHV